LTLIRKKPDAKSWLPAGALPATEMLGAERSSLLTQTVPAGGWLGFGGEASRLGGSRWSPRLLSALPREVEALTPQLGRVQTSVGADGQGSRGERTHGSDPTGHLAPVIRHSSSKH